MTNYDKLVAALRKVADYVNCYDCDVWGLGECDAKSFNRKSCVLRNAAAAIEALQAQLPKRGKWVRKEDELTHSYWYECSECGYRPHRENYPYLSDFCPNCGAKMEVQG